MYLRVSTNVQFEEGYSVGAQTENLEKYCNYQEIDNYDLYIDGGYSGSNLNRPEMKRLIKEIQEANSNCEKRMEGIKQLPIEIILIDLQDVLQIEYQ